MVISDGKGGDNIAATVPPTYTVHNTNSLEQISAEGCLSTQLVWTKRQKAKDNADD